MITAIGTIIILIGLVCLCAGGFFTLMGSGDELSDVTNDVRAAGCSGVVIGLVLIGFGLWLVR